VQVRNGVALLDKVLRALDQPAVRPVLCANQSSGTQPQVSTRTIIERARESVSAFVELSFDFFYLTDELVFYALKHEGHVGHFALRLAQLLYLVVFRHPVFSCFVLWSHYEHWREQYGSLESSKSRSDSLTDDLSTCQAGTDDIATTSHFFPPILVRWCKQLTHFLNFFPLVGPHILPLMEMYQFLRICIPEDTPS
jgi:hypothetical protein